MAPGLVFATASCELQIAAHVFSSPTLHKSFIMEHLSGEPTTFPLLWNKEIVAEAAELFQVRGLADLMMTAWGHTWFLSFAG